jgi:hypothetical protein
MADELEQLAAVLAPMRSAMSDHHHRLVGAGVPADHVAEAVIGWSARALSDAAGPAHAAQRLRDLAEAIEEGAELAGDPPAPQGVDVAAEAPAGPPVDWPTSGDVDIAQADLAGAVALRHDLVATLADHVERNEVSRAGAGEVCKLVTAKAIAEVHGADEIGYGLAGRDLRDFGARLAEEFRRRAAEGGVG